MSLKTPWTATWPPLRSPVLSVWGKGAFLALIEGGHTLGAEVLHPVTKRMQWRMTEADIAAFHEKLTTPTVMATKAGLHRNTILAVLSARRIDRFKPEGADVGPVYLRRMVDPVLDALEADEP